MGIFICGLVIGSQNIFWSGDHQFSIIGIPESKYYQRNANYK